MRGLPEAVGSRPSIGRTIGVDTNTHLRCEQFSEGLEGSLLVIPDGTDGPRQPVEAFQTSPHSPPSFSFTYLKLRGSGETYVVMILVQNDIDE